MKAISITRVTEVSPSLPLSIFVLSSRIPLNNSKGNRLIHVKTGLKLSLYRDTHILFHVRRKLFTETPNDEERQRERERGAGERELREKKRRRGEMTGNRERQG